MPRHLTRRSLPGAPRRLGVSVLLALVVGLWCGAGVTAPADADGPAWVWPLDGGRQVTRAFQPPQTPYGPGHRGVDLAGVPGGVVRAAGAGTVGYAGVLAGRGVVSIRHADGLRTTYEPATATVAAGDSVGAGDPIGRLDTGHAGCPVSACLHWGLLRGETYLDPLSLVGSGQARLYPRFGDDARPGMGGRGPPVLAGGPPTTDTEPSGRGESTGAVRGVTAAAVVAGAGTAAGWWRHRRRG